MTDPIADLLTRIRNASKSNHRVVDIPASNVKKEITRVLYEKGYILKYKFEETDNKQGQIRIALKYDSSTKLSAITELKRVSSPGLRKYVDADSLPRVLNGLGIAIISTSHGVMTDKEARVKNIGGEVLCYVS
jgi:small subunit ribosomal protein S8